MVVRGGFEPPKAFAVRFTVWSIWPLWYLTKFSQSENLIQKNTFKNRPLQQIQPFFWTLNQFLQRATNSSFLLLESFLTFASLLSASDLAPHLSQNNSFTGYLQLVNLHPLPLLCAATRFFTSLETPVYNLPSAHFTIYTNQASSVIILNWSSRKIALLLT